MHTPKKSMSKNKKSLYSIIILSILMIEIKTRLRRWGNSLGVIVPQKVIESEKVKEGDEITLLVSNKKPNLRKLYGKHKFKKPVEQIMKEMDKDLYG